MNDPLFIFGVIPGVFAFIGLMAQLVFGKDVLRWYEALKAEKAERASAGASARKVKEQAFVPAPEMMPVVGKGTLVPG